MIAGSTTGSESTIDVETVYRDWTTLHRVTFSLSTGDRVCRHVEDHGASASVLPFDPDRRCALLVSMGRAPVMLAGGDSLLEAPAGRCDDRDPMEVARSEAAEECGVRLEHLSLVMKAWTMPAISAEQSSMFLAEYSGGDRISAGGGLIDEGEEIQVFEISLAALWAMLENGKLPDLKTAFLLQALRLRRPELFSIASGADRLDPR